MLDFILQADQNTLVYLNQLGCTIFDSLWILISEKYTWIPLYIILLILLIKNFDKRNLILVLALMGIVFFFTDFMVSQVYRPFFHRLRPCHIPELAVQLRIVEPSCGGEYGFFSAHASNTFGLAIFIGNILHFRYQKLIYALVLWAAIVAYSRIYLGVHYPLDIICGALYGSTVSTLVFELAKKLNITHLEYSRNIKN